MAWSPAYATADELASFIGDASVGQDGTELTLAVEAASRSVDRCCDRQFGKVDAPTALTYAARYDPYRRRWTLDVDDLQTLDGLVIEIGSVADDSTVAVPVAGFTPAPSNAVARGFAWTQLVGGSSVSGLLGSAGPASIRTVPMKVTAWWGWNEVPESVKYATLLQASRLYSRRHAPFGMAGNPEVGQVRLLDKIDADVAVTLRPFARVWGAV